MDATGAHPVEGNKPETEQQIPNVLPYARELKFRKEENQTKKMHVCRYCCKYIFLKPFLMLSNQWSGMSYCCHFDVL